MSTEQPTRRLAFDLATDLWYAGIDANKLDMDAVKALYVAACDRLGYEFVDGRDSAMVTQALSDWADNIDPHATVDDISPMHTAWQAVHDTIPHDAILACRR